MPNSESAADAAPLRYAQPPDLGPSCRPVPRVDVLNTQDERVGTFDGLLLAATSNAPLYLVLQPSDVGQRRLIPIGSAWFDQTTEVIRVDDEDVQRASPFDLDEFERMTPTEVREFERLVLTWCCPEVLRGAGAPTYDGVPQFVCPDWLKASGGVR